MNQLVALQGNIQPNNAFGAFQNAQTHQQNLLQGDQAMAQSAQTHQQNMLQGEQSMQGESVKQAEHMLQLIGAAGMHALGGKVDGVADPAKYEEGLDMLEDQGLDVSQFRGKPQMANVAARASVTAMQAMQMHWRKGARFISPYFIDISGEKGDAAHGKMRITTDNPQWGSDHFYRAIQTLAKQ